MSKAQTTREAILREAFAQASQFGLESLTIGDLAQRCALSKSGLFGHFRSRDNLQLAVLEYAAEVFRERVITPVRQETHESQADKLRALLRAWLAWNQDFSGRCMFLDAWTSPQNGAVQQGARHFVHDWLTYLQRQIHQGIEQGAWQAELDPWQAVYRLYSLYLGEQVFGDLGLSQHPDQRFWPEVEALLASWRH